MSGPLGPWSIVEPTLVGLDAVRLPPTLRPNAELGVLTLSSPDEQESEQHRARARFVADRAELKQISVTASDQPGIETGNGWRHYRVRDRGFSRRRSLRRIVEHERPDLVELQCPWDHASMFREVTRHLDARLIWNYRGLTLDRDARPSGRDVRRVRRENPIVICGSDHAAIELEELGVERIGMVRPGVDLDTFTPSRRRQAATTRLALGLPEGPLALVTPGSPTHFATIVRAAPEIARRARLRIAVLGRAGDEAPNAGGPEMIWLDPLPSRADRADLLAAVDFVVAGPDERSGTLALEALSSGTAVLAPLESTAAELVSRSLAGERFEYGDPASVADGAVWLSRQNLAAFGLRAREYVERHHQWDRALENRFALYRRIVAGCR